MRPVPGPLRCGRDGDDLRGRRDMQGKVCSVHVHERGRPGSNAVPRAAVGVVASAAAGASAGAGFRAAAPDTARASAVGAA